MNQKDIRNIIDLLDYANRYGIVDDDGFIIEKYGMWYKYKNLAICSKKFNDKQRIFEDDLSVYVITNNFPIIDYCSNPILQGNFIYVFGESYSKYATKEYDWKFDGKWNKCFEDMISWLKIENQKIYLKETQNKDYDFFNSLF